MSAILPWQHELWRRLQKQRAEQRLPHALMFAGPAGVGKREFAAALASRLLCSAADQEFACGVCKSCELIRSGSHPDLLRLSPDEEGKVIKVDQVRAMIDRLHSTAQQGGYRVLVIHPAEEMNTASANAILKTLEEPGDETLIMLLVDQLGQIMPTIRSRCQRIDFPLPDPRSGTTWLADQAGIDLNEAEGLLAIARGSPILAKSWKAQGVLELRAKFLSGLADIIRNRESPLQLAEQLQKEDLGLLLTWWSSLLSDIVQMQLAAAVTPKTNPDMAKMIGALATRVNSDAIFALHDRLHQERAALLRHANPNKQLLLEKLLLAWKTLQNAG